MKHNTAFIHVCAHATKHEKSIPSWVTTTKNDSGVKKQNKTNKQTKTKTKTKQTNKNTTKENKKRKNGQKTNQRQKKRQKKKKDKKNRFQNLPFISSLEGFCSEPQKIVQRPNIILNDCSAQLQFLESNAVISASV